MIDNIALKRRVEGSLAERRVEVSLTGINIATYTVAAIFLPYILSTIILISLAVYILANQQTRQLVLVQKGSVFMKLFLAYALILPLIYKNWIGFAAGAGVVLAMVLASYIRAIMTSELFERMLTLICGLSLTSAGYAILEKITKTLEFGWKNQRISAVFFHPNYFGTIVGTVIIICAYKVLTKQNHKWFYCMVALVNVFSMYLCKSMFVWVEVFIGVAVLLFVLKRYRLLALWLSAAAAGAFMILFANLNIIPRLNDVEVTVGLRQRIWELTIDQIRQTPLFGHGLYSFIYLFDCSYRNQLLPHAHSIYLDLLLNFGIIGTSMFLIFTVKYYRSVLSICFKKKNTMITSLILAVTASALVHGTTDVTLLWVQTLPLFLFIMSGLGAYENNEAYNTLTCKDKFYKVVRE